MGEGVRKLLQGPAEPLGAATRSTVSSPTPGSAAETRSHTSRGCGALEARVSRVSLGFQQGPPASSRSPGEGPKGCCPPGFSTGPPN